MILSRTPPTWVSALPPFPSPPGWFDEILGVAYHPAHEVEKLVRVESALGHTFQDRRLLRCALTSPGWVNEHPMPRGGAWPDNKALEWLGDALLYLTVTETLVLDGSAEKTGKSTPSRALLVSNSRLSEAGEALDLWEALYLSKGERQNNAATGRKRFLACAVEATIGAVYLDALAADAVPLDTVRPIVARLLLMGGDAVVTTSPDGHRGP